MSDNDLVKRGEVADAAFEILKMLTEAEHHGKIDRTLFSLLYHDIGAIAFLPAVPQEMSAREYHLIKRRMCKNCPVCPLNEAAINLFIDCKRFEREFPNEAVAIVEKWAREHSEERSENETDRQDPDVYADRGGDNPSRSE